MRKNLNFITAITCNPMEIKSLVCSNYSIDVWLTRLKNQEYKRGDFKNDYKRSNFGEF